VSETWRVERAERALVGRVYEIARASFEAPWSEAAFDEEFRNPDARVWVARDAAGEVQGYLVAHRMLDEVHLLSLATRPAARRRGAARALLDAVLHAERAGGARLAHLEVRAGNGEALAFYAKAGFRALGRRRRYYPDGEDALLLATALVEPLRAGEAR
jgi:ribosomal-protein-alanine N-acetyltransferase